MIVFTTKGFLELAVLPGRPGHFLVSAWAEGDIERAFPGTEVQSVDPDTGEALWRRYKATVRKEAVFDLLLSEARGIDYDAIYRHLPGARHRMMLEEWQSMWAEDSYERWKRRNR